MLKPEVLAIVFGLASAASWGSGDFSGGLASRRGNVYSVVIVSQLVGALILIGLAFVLEEKPPVPNSLILGGMAGIGGVIGLMALYTGLASRHMGIVAPLTAVMTAALPLLVSLFTEGLPKTSHVVGFGLALVAVWLLSSAGGGVGARARELGLAITAGL